MRNALSRTASMCGMTWNADNPGHDAAQ